MIILSLTLEQIIDEADILIPNANTPADKVIWLNAINQEFFEIVKIPLVEQFVSTALKTYTLTGNIRAKNIDKVQTGNLNYKSLLYEDVQPNQNNYVFTDSDKKLILSVVPSQASDGFVRYAQTATTTFVAGSLTISPDAPSEYHWIYVLGLCEKVAKANDDVSKVNNYGNDYRTALAVAAQNYLKEASK